MKKILVALLVIGLAGVYSCSKNDPGIQPPSTFGEVTTPSAVITLGKNVFATNETITFSASAMNTGSYSWDFGDASSKSTEASPTHSYTNAGRYKVTLVVYSADKGHSYTAVTYVVIGTVYWDSTVVVQIPPADSSGNAWDNPQNLNDPYTGFNFAKVSGGGQEIPTGNMRFVQFSPQKLWDINYHDSLAAHKITPEDWIFYLVYAKDNTLSSIYPMHSWTRDMSKETDWPIVLRGTRPEDPYKVMVYWHAQ